MVPRVVAQEGRGRAARAGARAAGAAAAAAGAATAPHPLRRAEVPGGRRRHGRGSTRWRGAGPRVLFRRDLTAFPHLLELGPAVLEPDFDLCGKGTRTLVEEPGSGAGEGRSVESTRGRRADHVPRPPRLGWLPLYWEAISENRRQLVWVHRGGGDSGGGSGGPMILPA